MALEFKIQQTRGEFSQLFKDKYRDMAKAGTAAIRGAGEQARDDGKAAIAAAGFSKTWQNAWHLELYPSIQSQKFSLNAAAFLVHKIPYADLFEFGGTVTGQLLWIPFSTTPRKLGANTLSASRFQKEIGGLRTLPFKTSTGRPILGAPMAVNGPKDHVVSINKLKQGKGLSVIPRTKAGKESKNKRLRAKFLREGPIASLVGKGSRIRLQPLFFGVQTVTIGKKFDLTGVTERAALTLAARYVQAFKDQK